MSQASMLVVAGEASGDRAAAAVLSKLRANLPALRAFGMGGAALANVGLDVLSDLRESTALGLGEVAARTCNVALAYTRIRQAVRSRRPSCALLVNYTEFNTHLAKSLWASGVRVLWYAAPQIWAWRAGRGIPIRRSIDRMAVILPFEEALWRKFGADAHYVGHPALEDLVAAESAVGAASTREVARERLGLTPFAPTVAILPGSRPHEVRRLLPAMLGGYDAVRHDRASLDARVMLASSLDAKTRDWACRLAAAARVEVRDVDAKAGIATDLPAFDVSIVASGTASLECALAHATPIVCYRVGLVTELGARALLRTPFVALPNVLLGRAAFPELLQRDAVANVIAKTLANTLDDRPTTLAACEDVRASLGGKATPSSEVARMLEPWLTAAPEPRRSRLHAEP